MRNQTDSLEERETRLQLMIKEYEAAEKRRRISLGIALWTRTEIEHSMARDAKSLFAKVN